MSELTTEKNKAIALEAFEAAFNKRDPGATERYWSPNYLQHSAHIPPGRDGLFGLIAALPPSLKYENQFIAADGDLVMLYGRFSTGLERAQIITDIVRIVDGKLVEHWDVWQSEATKEESKSGLPMFGNAFAV